MKKTLDARVERIEKTLSDKQEEKRMLKIAEEVREMADLFQIAYRFPKSYQDLRRDLAYNRR